MEHFYSKEKLIYLTFQHKRGELRVRPSLVSGCCDPQVKQQRLFVIHGCDVNI